MSVTEPSDALNAGMSKLMEGCKLVLSCKSLPSVSSLVGWLVGRKPVSELQCCYGCKSWCDNIALKLGHVNGLFVTIVGSFHSCKGIDTQTEVL